MARDPIGSPADRRRHPTTVHPAVESAAARGRRARRSSSWSSCCSASCSSGRSPPRRTSCRPGRWPRPCWACTGSWPARTAGSGSPWGWTSRAGRAGRSAPTAARPTSTGRRRSCAAATGCWCRRASTTCGRRGAGRSPSSSTRSEPDAGLRQARRRPAGRVGPDRRRRRLHRRPDRPQDAGRAAGDAHPGLRPRLRPRGRRPLSALDRPAGRAGAAPRRAAGGRGARGSSTSRRPAATSRIDWLEYRHWDPDRGGYGPVRDFIGVQRRRGAGASTASTT